MVCNENFFLDRFIQIKGCLCTPLNLVCLIEIIKDDQRLPETLTKLYASLVSALLVRHIQESEYKHHCLTVDPDNISDLPSALYQNFLKVCEIAYRKLVGNDKDNNEGVQNEDALGLLTINQKPTYRGIETSYTFAHSSIQEFLAAYYISRKSPQDIEKHFHRMYEHRLLQVLLFLSNFSPPETDGLRKYFDFFSYVENGEVHFRRLSFFQILFEARKESCITEFLEDDKKVVVRRTASTLDPHMMYILGRCIRFSKSIWEVHFTCRKLDFEQVEMLRQGLASHDTEMGHIEELLWGYNSIGNNVFKVLQSFPPSELRFLRKLDVRGTELISCTVLAECLHMFEKLEILLMNDNDIGYGEHMPLILAINQVNPKPLRQVSFSRLTSEECIALLSRDKLTNIKLWLLSSDDLSQLVSSLRSIECSTVTTIKIRASEVNHDGIFNLCTLPSLNKLKFVNCIFNAKNTPPILGHGLSAPQLRKLDLSRSILDSSACEVLATYLPTFSGLKDLLLKDTNPHIPCQYTPLIMAINEVDPKPIKKVSFANLTYDQCIRLLSRNSLETIKLWQISGVDIRATVSQMPFNNTLTVLKICESKVDAESIEELPIALQNLPSLSTLGFICCGIDCKAVKTIAKALNISRNITTL